MCVSVCIISAQQGCTFPLQLQRLLDHWGNAGHSGEGEGSAAALNPLGPLPLSPGLCCHLHTEPPHSARGLSYNKVSWAES